MFRIKLEYPVRYDLEHVTVNLEKERDVIKV